LFVLYLIQVLNIEPKNKKSLVGGKQMLEKMKNLVVEEEGQALTEYGLIIALVALAVIIALTAVGGQLNTLFGQIKTALTT